MAGRLAAGLPRRPRLRLQVEHGLDARHARLLRSTTRSTAATTTTSSRSRSCTRSARTSSCRSRTTRSCTARARSSTKMPGDRWQKLANLRALYALHVGAPGQEAALHGRRARAVARVERTRRRSTGTCSSERDHQGVQSLVRDLNRVYRDDAGAVGGRLRADGLPLARAERRRRRTSSRSRASARTRSGRSSASATSRRCRATATASACRSAAAGARSLNTDAAYYGGSGRRQPRRGRGRARRRGTTSRSRPS